MTGSNSEPLGTRNRLNRDQGAADVESHKRGRSPERSIEGDINAAIDGARRRKKRNRWGAVSENKAAGLMGLPTAIHANMTTEQLDAYALHLRIEEISQKLRINDVVPADGDRWVFLHMLVDLSSMLTLSRSPSPPPQYDNFGKRVNTREYRYRKRLEDERHKLVEKALKTIPDYHPPSDYRRPTKTQEKVYVPVNDYPEINFSEILTLTCLLTPLLPLLPPSCRVSIASVAAMRCIVHHLLSSYTHVTHLLQRQKLTTSVFPH